MHSLKDEWITLYSSSREVELLALEEALAEAGIETARVDRRDSMYPMLGQVQLLVHSNDAQRAQAIVAQFQDDNEHGG